MTTDPPRTARERARQEVMVAILEAGRRELAEHGADGLSLRAVAREVGMVSSAVYRYVASRDDLLTALISEAYGAVADAAEHAASARTTPGRRFVRLCGALRTWGQEHPHEYALLYGSPVPGYQAPEATTDIATRTPRAAAALVQEAYDAGTLEVHEPEPPLGRVLAGQCAVMGEALGLSLPEPVVLRLAHAWTQVYGAISFELFGQLRNTFDPADAFAAHTFATAARHVGFTDL
ncbi:TetR/AcrR family transcriptional regulator [Luteipulveratus sp. YIM 133132]|uniref:TetR/AcrR family transcriptional regulator n=1 Tax=Luteipulveratus flavus TaxID=3031728 RepID=UPI0023AEE0EB|nr:TetR/AcrR family transcriptional regulator [Luteipulveratus sp. YIM 133132]MDE9366970.1 TetR/AcrR family transcriptional regulator [Luteipulveratus sp. YIM 133132]